MEHLAKMQTLLLVHLPLQPGNGASELHNLHVHNKMKLDLLDVSNTILKLQTRLKSMF